MDTGGPIQYVDTMRKLLAVQKILRAMFGSFDLRIIGNSFPNPDIWKF